VVHPAAELFPLMTREELIALANDIKENGFRPDQRLIFTKFGDRLCLVDGRNRLDALEYLGYEIFDENKKPRPLGWVMTDDDDGILKYVISANLHRRHLTTEQRRELIAKVLKAKPAASDREIAARVKADDKTVAKVRTELEATAEIPQLKKTKGKDGKERPARKSPAPVPSPASPKAEQKVFDSPQGAHATKSNAIDLGSLSVAWREVEAHAAAGNKHRLKSALQHLLKEASAALARVRS
jgi:hypothetical protein